MTGVSYSSKLPPAVEWNKKKRVLVEFSERARTAQAMTIALRLSGEPCSTAQAAMNPAKEVQLRARRRQQACCLGSYRDAIPPSARITFNPRISPH